MNEPATAVVRRMLHQTQRDMRSWVNNHTMGASWLPSRLRHPWAGVLIGLTLIGLIFVGAPLVQPLLQPDFSSVRLGTLLLFMAIVLTAIVWGMGPSMLVTLLGIVVLNHIQWYPYPALELDSSALIMEDLLIFVIGVLIGYLAGQNVAARKHAEQMRQRSEAERHRLDTVIEVLPSGVALSDEEGNLLRFNSQFKAIWGEDAPLVGTADYARFQARWLDTGLPVSPDQWALSRAVRQGEVCPGDEIEIVTFDGQRKTILNAAAPIRDPDGVIVGGVVAEMDISERNRREQQVREALHALLALAQALIGPTEGPQRRDEEGTARESLALAPYVELIREIFACRQVHVGTIDPATGLYTLVASVGLSPAEVRRLKATLKRASLRELLFSAEQHADLASGASIVVDPKSSARIARDLGLPPSASAVIAPLRWEGHLIGLLGLAFLQEEAPYGLETQALVEASARLAELILERERIVAQREEARAAAKALEETTQRMDAFVAVATHELRTPLIALGLTLHVSRRRLERLQSQTTDRAPLASGQYISIVDDLAELESQVKRLERLVNDMMDLSRSQTGKLQIRPELTDLRPIVQRAVKEQQEVAPTRTIRLHLPPSDQPIMVRADPDRIAQVIVNYVTNALKYSPADQPVDVDVEVETTKALVSVRDQGPGLQEAEQERLWQRYYRVPGIEVQSGTGVGLGLGLTIVRQIVELHAGEVGVESAPGRGSTFWFTLPLAGTSAAE
jgi:signal transduction histidine kinase/PAS domain-containing protein